MIVVGRSAPIAILFDEPERASFMAVIADAQARMISMLTLYETRLVVRAKGGAAVLADLDELLAEMQPEIVPFDAVRVRATETTYARYGRGIHAAARLNLVDCAAYALAIEPGVPLPFKGNDFAATDVPIARAAAPTQFGTSESLAKPVVRDADGPRRDDGLPHRRRARATSPAKSRRWPCA